MKIHLIEKRTSPIPQPITGPRPDRRRSRLAALLLAVMILLSLALPTAHAQGGNSITAPDTAGDVGVHTAMALDSNGYPVISYYDLTNGTLKLMHCNDPDCAGNDESITAPDQALLEDMFQGIFVEGDLTLDSNGYPVILYNDIRSGLVDLKVMHCNDANCAGGDESITTLETSAYAYAGSLRLDSSGYPVILHLGGVIHCNDANCTGGDESVVTADIVGINGISGPFTSLALDSSGYPVISYVDSDPTGSALNVIHCNDPDCSGGDESLTSPATVSGIGGLNSLVLDSSGYPVVSYYDSTNQDLKVLHCNDANCSGNDESISSPDTNDITGYYASLALDSNGYPVISYGSNNGSGDAALKVMHCNDPNCTGNDERITAPDTADFVGLYISLALDSSGYPVVSYYDITNGDLKLLHCGTADCIIPTDATPPVIAANVSGTLGNNGWYISDVTVTWDVSDAESTVTTTTGCETTTIDSDTTGTTLTCEATSEGGTNSASVTIQRDTTPPFAFVTGVQDGSIYLPDTVPTTGCDARDDGSGVATNASLTISGGEDNGQGLLSYFATCEGATDNAGNISVPFILGYFVEIVDTTPPVITPNANGTPGNNGWYVSDVTLTWDISDAESTVSATNGCDPTTINSDTAGTTLTCQATSQGGTNSAEVTIQRDATPPTISVTGVEDGASYEMNTVPAADCDTQDALAGVATNASLTTSGGDGNGLGSFTATCDGATDNAGNSADPVSVSYTVIAAPTTYNFTGFFSPIDNLPTINQVKGGQAIPVKFSLNGDQGLDIFADGYPASQEVACDSNAPVNEVEETDTAGNSSLSYDPDTDTYTYVWKTMKGWSGACRQLIVRLNDGNEYSALFQFK